MKSNKQATKTTDQWPYDKAKPASPGQTRSTPGLSGQTPGQSGQTPGQSGTRSTDMGSIDWQRDSRPAGKKHTTGETQKPNAG